MSIQSSFSASGARARSVRRAWRVWLAAERFPALAEHYAFKAGLREFSARSVPWRRLFDPVARLLRLPGAGGSAYDRFMLHFHDYLKENADFQARGDKLRIEFPPEATWLVFTDGVPHAVLSGQFALEQTFLIPAHALVAPQHAPICVLEKLSGRPLS